jgi:hypothetical protein
MRRSSRRRRTLVLWLLFAVACDHGQPAGGPVSAISATNANLATPPSSTTTADTAEGTTVAPNGDARVHATVVATWGGEHSSWLLVDLADGETIEGSTRVVVELDRRVRLPDARRQRTGDHR